MVLEAVQSSGTEIGILLVLAIVVALVIAFKIMEMVFETVLVTALSGAFYMALRYIQGGSISINDLLLFSFLGATLYMLYSLLDTVYQVGATVIPMPYKITKTLAWPFRKIGSKYREYQKKKSYTDRDKTRKTEDKSTKEVVLGNEED